MGKDLPGGILEILEQNQKTCLYRIGLAPGVIDFDGRRVKYFSMTQEHGDGTLLGCVMRSTINTPHLKKNQRD